MVFSILPFNKFTDNPSVDCQCPGQITSVALTGRLCEFTSALWLCFIHACYLHQLDRQVSGLTKETLPSIIPHLFPPRKQTVASIRNTKLPSNFGVFSGLGSPLGLGLLTGSAISLTPAARLNGSAIQLLVTASMAIKYSTSTYGILCHVELS